MKNTSVKLIADYIVGRKDVEENLDGWVDEAQVLLVSAFGIPHDKMELEYRVGWFAVALVGSLIIEWFINSDDYSDKRGRLQLGAYHWFKDLSYLESFVWETNVGKFVEEYIKSHKKNSLSLIKSK